MRKNIDYYEEDGVEKEQVFETSMELIDFIEQKIANEPAKGKLHSIWKKEVNELIDLYNSSYTHIYKHVK